MIYCLMVRIEFCETDFIECAWLYVDITLEFCIATINIKVLKGGDVQNFFSVKWIILL